MEKLTAWLSDKKNLPIVVAGASIVLILAVLFMLKMTGTIGGGGGGGEITPDMGMPLPGQPGVPGPGAPGAPPAGPVTPTPGAPGPGPGAPAPPGATVAVMPPMLPYRKDPFLPLTGLPTKQDVMAMMLPALRRPRIAPAPVPPLTAEGGGVTVTEVLPPQPFRRMAGVLWNGSVSAILETNGETDIVRPGMEITRGNSKARVESIQQDCIILKSLDTKTPYYIRVSMRGAVTGPNAPGQDQNQMISGGNPGEM